MQAELNRWNEACNRIGRRHLQAAAELSATVSLPPHSFASVCVMLKNDKLTSGCIPTDKKLSQRDRVSAHGRYTTYRRKMSGVVLVVKTNIVPRSKGVKL